MENKHKYNWGLVKEFLEIQVWPFIRKRWYIFLLFPVTVAEGFISPYFFGEVVTTLSSGKADWSVIAGLMMNWVLVSLLIVALVTYLYSMQFDELAIDIIRNLRHEMAKVLFYFDVKKFLDHKPGEIYTKLDKMEYSTVDMVNLVLSTYLRAGLFWVFSAFYIFWLDFWLGVVFSFGELLFMGFFSFRNSYLMKKQEVLNRWTSEINGDLQDKTSNLLIVKNQAREKWEIQRFFGKYKDLFDEDRKLSKVWRISRTGLEFMQMVLIVVGVGVGYWAIVQRGMNVGAMVTCLWLFQRGGNEMKNMTQSWKMLNKFLTHISDGQEIMRMEIIVKDRVGAGELKVKRGEIEFKKVNFDYEGKKAISNFNLTIPAGKTVAFVGHSGAGKSTLAALMMRYYDIKSGEILIDGQNIADVKQESLRRQMAFVMQDNSLFHEDLEFNIAYGREKTTKKQIAEAARKAQVHDFIAGLEDGYGTKVGQRGLRLSGGERQRIAIARAILKDAPIMVLDEATSALDSINERKVQKALNVLMKGKTSIVIAHRLSTVKKADLIVVLSKGRIVETGTHAELVGMKGGYYAKLVKEQVNGMIV